jgi:hypothetical protein
MALARQPIGFRVLGTYDLVAAKRAGSMPARAASPRYVSGGADDGGDAYGGDAHACGRRSTVRCSGRNHSRRSSAAHSHSALRLCGSAHARGDASNGGPTGLPAPANFHRSPSSDHLQRCRAGPLGHRRKTCRAQLRPPQHSTNVSVSCVSPRDLSVPSHRVGTAPHQRFPAEDSTLAWGGGSGSAPRRKKTESHVRGGSGYCVACRRNWASRRVM